MSLLVIAVLVGLWDFPPVPASPESGAVDTVEVRAGPSSSSAIVATLDARGIRTPTGAAYSCVWVRDLDVTAHPGGCVFTESGYEIPALAVFDRRGDWVQIALDDTAEARSQGPGSGARVPGLETRRPVRFGWVPAGDRFHPLVELLASQDHLTYLTKNWDGALYRAARGNAATMKLDATREPPYRAIGHVLVQGRLWLHVEILDEVCRVKDPRVVATGWVPAQSQSGERWAWFYSRGC